MNESRNNPKRVLSVAVIVIVVALLSALVYLSTRTLADTTAPDQPALTEFGFFPKSEYLDGEIVSLASETWGVLLEVDGCLRIEGADSRLVIWPPNYTLAGPGVVAEEETGRVVARVDDKVHLAGGESSGLRTKSAPGVSEATAQAVRDSGCQGPYWYAGRVLEVAE